MSPPLHYICADCQGDGTILVARAAIHQGSLGTAHVGEKCRRCEGTGWTPPKHGGPALPDEDD